MDDPSASQSQSQSGSQQTDSLSTADEIEVDFRSLSAKTRRLLEDEQATVKLVAGLEKAVREAEERFGRLQAPSADAKER